MLISGESLDDEHVNLLADVVGGEIRDRLRVAVAQKTSIMTLSRSDREHIFASLREDAPWQLARLREVMEGQLQRRARLERNEKRVAASRRARGWAERETP